MTEIVTFFHSCLDYWIAREGTSIQHHLHQLTLILVFQNGLGHTAFDSSVCQFFQERIDSGEIFQRDLADPND